MNEPRACPDCLRRAWLLAALTPYIEKVVSDAAGRNVRELLRLDNENLAAAVAPETAAAVLERVEAQPERRFRDELATSQCWACCRHDDRYPLGLRDADDGPWALIGRGAPTLLARLSPGATVAVVGTRRATSYGREVARGLGCDLAREGMTVVSGLGFGVDSCAHRGALEGGATVAVLGCGADVAYPEAHRSLWRRITKSGLVLSELPPGTGAWRWAFAARNRTIAALCGMTVVVETARGSGSSRTTDIAADLGREIGAVPGPVNSRTSVGPNELLAGGAHLIRDAVDVLTAIAS